MTPIPRLQGDVNVAEFDRAMALFLKNSKLSVIEAFRFQGRKLFERIINWKGGAIATPPQTKKQGEAAVKRDIYRAVFPLRAEGFNDARTTKRVRAAIAGGQVRALQKMVTSGLFGKNVKGAIVGNFKPEMHTRQRNSRGGVSKNAVKHYRFATPQESALQEYVKRRQQMVGQGKGGWAAALIRLGGKPAAWVARHAKAGVFEDRLNTGLKDFSFTGINRSGWASGGDEDRIIEMAMEGRAQAIVADVERKLEAKWKEAA